MPGYPPNLELSATELTHIGGGMWLKLYYHPTGQTANEWFDLEASGFEDYIPVGIQGVLTYDTRPDVRANTNNWFVSKPTIGSGKVEAFCNLASTGQNIIIVFYLKL